MKLRVNGERITIPSSVATITELLAYIQVKNPVTIVEHNENILEKHDYDSAKLSDGDKIELVQFVGGG
ncbi:sulfur carrier protein ThiS [Lentibacillus sp. L22]|uniref:sulfur carrier protein ThiS n=1 Tax=Lentibacillus TaxID=175304 RepID=UPI0022B14C8D|nr:sulfur carrier protein ThiS [Lentibacillus daqui]